MLPAGSWPGARRPGDEEGVTACISRANIVDGQGRVGRADDAAIVCEIRPVQRPLIGEQTVVSAGGDDRNGFAGVRYLSWCWQRCPIPQERGIVQGGCILGVALKNVLKLFEGIIQLFLFV